jgi:hypothetical protein
MKLKEKILSLFKKRSSLRDKCIQTYGPEFGEIYDNLCSGIPVGGFLETAAILQMIEDVKNNKVTTKVNP